MDTLINASDHAPEEGRVHSLPRNGLTPDATAGSQGMCTTGVSIENILTPTFPLPAHLRWHVMRVSYGRELEAHRLLRAQGVLSYVPTRKSVKITDGKKTRTQQSILPNLLFVFTDEASAATLTQRPLPPAGPQRKDKAPLQLRHMYDHTRHNAQGRDLRVTIPNAEMANFIRFTLTGSEHLRTVDEDEFRIKGGETVEVTEGDFKGVTGRVVRIHRQTCLLVDLRPVCLMASAYIPKGWLRPRPEA